MQYAIRSYIRLNTYLYRMYRIWMQYKKKCKEWTSIVQEVGLRGSTTVSRTTVVSDSIEWWQKGRSCSFVWMFWHTEFCNVCQTSNTINTLSNVCQKEKRKGRTSMKVFQRSDPLATIGATIPHVQPRLVLFLDENTLQKWNRLPSILVLVFSINTPNTHHVHSCCHWEVKGVKSGLVFHNSLVPGRQEGVHHSLFCNQQITRNSVNHI